MAKDESGDEKLLDHVALVLQRSLVDSCVPERAATVASLEVIGDLQRTFGGQTVYIPKGRTDVSERAAEVFDFFSKGESIKQIAARFECTDVWVYRLLSRERNRLKLLRQTINKNLRA